MDDQQKYTAGYFEGWQSVAGPRLHFPDIPNPPHQANGSLFIHGLMKGIAAAKYEMARLNAANRTSSRSLPAVTSRPSGGAS